MPLVLAIEPDRRQAARVANIIRRMVGAELILVDDVGVALETLRTRVPELVLVPALLLPKDDAVLSEALRSVGGPAAVPVLITPQLANGKSSIGAGLISK